MKKQRILFILAGALVLVAVILFFSNPWQTLKTNGKNFAIDHPETITSALLTYHNDTIELVKRESKWEVNSRFSAQQRSLNLLLNLLTDIEIKSPVSRKNTDLILKKLETDAKQLIVYSGKKKLRTYLMTADSTHTYMMLKGSGTPYLVELKGYSGVNLFQLIPVQLDFWRNNSLFNFNPAEIASVEVIYPGKTDDSYKIVRNRSSFRLYRWDDDKELKGVNKNTVVEYFSFFTRLEFTIPTDSVRQKALKVTENNDPVFMLTVITVDGTENTVKAYRMPISSSVPAIYNTDKFYALINDDSELVIMNYIDFDPLLKTVNYFLKK